MAAFSTVLGWIFMICVSIGILVLIYIYFEDRKDKEVGQSYWDGHQKGKTAAFWEIATWFGEDVALRDAMSSLAKGEETSNVRSKWRKATGRSE